MELGFLVRRVSIGMVVTRNFFPQSITTSRAERPAVSLSREALRSVRERFRTLSPGIRIEPQPLTMSGIDRRQRSLYFVQAARQANDLGVKIANYCTALESLFGTDSAELTHRLSERVACFLENKVENRLAVYKQVKAAYGLRSKVVHGAGGKVALDRLAETAEQMDAVLRRALTLIYNNAELMDRFNKPASSNDEQYFLALTLGRSQDVDTTSAQDAPDPG